MVVELKAEKKRVNIIPTAEPTLFRPITKITLARS